MPRILSIIGLSILLCACQPANINQHITSGNDDAAKAMLKQGQGINQLDYDGTPLCAAASANNVRMAQYLIANGADVNFGNEDGYLSKSPLHSAAGTGSVDVATLLLANGADTHIRNRDNLTPLETAQAEGQLAMVALLSEYETINASWDQAVKLNTVAGYRHFVAAYPDTAYQQAAETKIAELTATEERQQHLENMEAQLPASVRRDKYMVQLSQALKTQQYQQALDIFPKLEALPIATDPSLKFFYGEALLKTNQPGPALEQLYQYINEQGSSATHYARALELMNQAEAQL
ncbi:MAG: ankyrin repeat domain-containing protein [Halioglobus sp.]|nr:ankyrin repeat domain-containing protein [Halioglobus sp.]